MTIMRLIIGFTALTFISAEPVLASVNCKPLGYGGYTLQSGDTCATLAANRKLNFKNYGQIQAINSKLTRFSCSNTRKGQLICHPLKQEGS